MNEPNIEKNLSDHINDVVGELNRFLGAELINTATVPVLQVPVPETRITETIDTIAMSDTFHQVCGLAETDGGVPTVLDALHEEVCRNGCTGEAKPDPNRTARLLLRIAAKVNSDDEVAPGAAWVSNADRLVELLVTMDIYITSTVAATVTAMVSAQMSRAMDAAKFTGVLMDMPSALAIIDLLAGIEPSRREAVLIAFRDLIVREPERPTVDRLSQLFAEAVIA